MVSVHGPAPLFRHIYYKATPTQAGSQGKNRSLF
jgi:hypothetical protein